MLISWSNVLQVLLAALSGLLGYYLFTLQRCHAMTLFLLGLAAHNLLALTADLLENATLAAVAGSLRFLYAPLIYFATRELLYASFRYQPQHLWHLAPFALALAAALLSPQLADRIAWSVGPLVVGYIIASYLLVARFRRIIDQTRSSGEPPGLTWLTRILHGYSALIAFELLRAGLGLVLPDAVTAMAHMLFLLVICLLLAYLVLQGLRHPTLLPAVVADEQALADRPTASTRPVAPALQQRLSQFMDAEKPYLNPQLSVGDLAEAMDIPGRALSQCINDNYGSNFSEFINRARVEEARGLIADPANDALSMLDIGLSAGFNSKTSFNVMFKRYTGMTPTNYRLRCNEERLASNKSTG